MKYLFVIFFFILLTAGQASAQGSGKSQSLDSLKVLIERQPDSLALVQRYLDMAGFPNAAVIAQFETWKKQFPRSSSFPAALGIAYFKIRDRSQVARNLLAVKILHSGWNEELSRMLSVAGYNEWEQYVTETPNTLDSLKKLVEATPDSSLPVRQYVLMAGSDKASTVAQIDAWMKRFPDAVSIPYALGESFFRSEDPRGIAYLEKTVQLDPKNAKVWSMLSAFANARGDKKAAREYIAHAIAADPGSASYAINYATSFQEEDRKRMFAELYRISERFAGTDGGATALSLIVLLSNEVSERMKVGEQIRALYSPSKFTISGAMAQLYDDYLLQGKIGEAIALSKAMGAARQWTDRALLASSMDKIGQLAADKRYHEASMLLDSLKVPSEGLREEVGLLRASMLDATGATGAAYDSLLVVQARTPGDKLGQAIERYGAKLGKSAAEEKADLWAIRERSIRPAPAFDLGMYTSKKTLSLASYKGKVLLLTFFFPGCGPCRGEFPHFENVLRRFRKGEVAYAGINVEPKQDELVMPLLQGLKVSFTPLRGNGDWAFKTYGVIGAPSNFLIDQDGRIVFSRFRIDDEQGERMLELMIRSMLDKAKDKAAAEAGGEKGKAELLIPAKGGR